MPPNGNSYPAASLSASPRRRLRLLILQSYTGVGGAETALLNLLDGLQEDTTWCEIVTLGHGNGALDEALHQHGHRLTPYPGARFRRLDQTLVAIRWLAEKISRENFDVVLANGGHPNLYARPAALWARRPSVWWVHDHSFADPLRAGPLGWLQGMVAADLLMANSSMTEQKLRAYFPGTPVATVRPGVNERKLLAALDRGGPLRASLGIPESECIVGMAARYQPGKGHLLFLEAAARMVHVGFPGRFWIIAARLPWQDSGYAGHLRESTKRLGLQHRVTFLEDQPDAPAWLAACDIVVQPALQPETLGLVAAEAMVLGRPLVATAHGGALEMVTHGQDGWLVPPNESTAIAEAVMHLWSDPALCRRLGEQAARKAREQFSSRRTAEQFRALLEPLAHSRSQLRQANNFVAVCRKEG